MTDKLAYPERMHPLDKTRSLQSTQISVACEYASIVVTFEKSLAQAALRPALQTMPGGCGAVDERGNKHFWAFIPVDCYRRQVN